MPVTRKDIAVPSENEQPEREESLVDFGFSTNERPPTSTIKMPVVGDVSKYKETIDFIVKRLFTFLDFLAEHPENEWIRWPDRLTKIVAFKKEISKKLDVLKKE